MKTVTVRECRTCQAKIIIDENAVTLNPNDEIDIVVLTVARCNQCKVRQIRTQAGPKVPFTGN